MAQSATPVYSTAQEGETIHQLDINHTAPGTIGHYWLHLIDNALGEPIRLPVLVARGKTPGAVLGITAAIHGNELNGIPIIQQLFASVDVQQLRGTVVAVPVVNIPGFLQKQRTFNDNEDLNRIAPGKPKGNRSQLYMHRLVERLLPAFEYLIDLHTASFGNVNSVYVRADLGQAPTNRMAHLLNPEIILNNAPKENTWRGAAAQRGIQAVTIELKNPYVFQESVVEEAVVGVCNILFDLNMLEGTIQHQRPSLIHCVQSYWLYTEEGGILKVFPEANAHIQKDQRIAEVRSVFGKLIREYFAPEDGVVIGKSVNPVNQSGSRILHLGVQPQEVSIEAILSDKTSK
ncbi:MAG: succinylglutamate desuccinylase/aspartoacylase family protein, partial [Saprospiraceae bacterium]